MLTYILLWEPSKQLTLYMLQFAQICTFTVYGNDGIEFSKRHQILEHNLLKTIRTVMKKYVMNSVHLFGNRLNKEQSQSETEVSNMKSDNLYKPSACLCFAREALGLRPLAL